MLSSAKYRTLPGPRHPTDLIGVAHSPAYFIAAAVADRGYGWIHASPVKVADPVIGQLIDKVTVDPNPPAVPGPLPAPPRRDGHDHAEGRPTVLCITSTFRADPGPAESNGPTWTRSTGGWCRCPGWRPEKVEASLKVVHEFETVKIRLMRVRVRLLS